MMKIYIYIYGGGDEEYDDCVDDGCIDGDDDDNCDGGSDDD